MLPQKQKCLAMNRIGMRCHCDALSNGHCRAHSLLSADAPVLHTTARTLGALFSWVVHGLVLNRPVSERRLRLTPAALNL